MMEYESELRVGFFLGLLALFSLLECLVPRRSGPARRRQRWRDNLGLGVLDTLAVRAVFLFIPAGTAAAWAQGKGIGLFNVVEGIPGWVAVFGSLILLDLVVYVQHVVFHLVPFLWRFHKVHHTDLHLDATSALRFHPVEILVSMVIKIGAILALGCPLEAVIAFEIVLNGAAMFNHSNWAIPTRVDGLLRLFLVTPDMHRVHHSVIRNETDSNFGFNLPWWDRLFGTYRPQPEDGHVGMTLGLEDYLSARQHLGWLLALPWGRTAPPGDPD